MTITNQQFPILGASACVWREGKVLLIQRGKNPGRGKWSLPGGKLESGEQPLEAAVRELLEETNVVADLTQLIGEYKISASDGTALYVISCYFGIYTSGEATPGSDAEALLWADPNELSQFELAPNINSAIADARKLLTD